MKGVASPVARILAEGMQAHVGIDAVGYGGIVTYVPLGTPGASLLAYRAPAMEEGVEME